MPDVENKPRNITFLIRHMLGTLRAFPEIGVLPLLEVDISEATRSTIRHRLEVDLELVRQLPTYVSISLGDRLEELHLTRSEESTRLALERK